MVQNLKAKLTIDYNDQFSKDLNRSLTGAKNDLKSLSQQGIKTGKALNNNLKAGFKSFGKIASRMALVGGTALVGVGTKALKSFMDYNRMYIPIE